MKKMYALLLIGIGLASVPAMSQEEDVLRPRGKSAAEIAAESSSGSRASSSWPRWAIGLELGANYNMFSQTITGATENSNLDILKSGTGVALFGAWIVDVGFNDAFGAQLRVLYDVKDNRNSGAAKIDCPNAVPGMPPNVADINVEYEDKYTYTTVEALLRYNVTPRLMITAGPSFHFPRGTSTSRYKEVITSDNCTFIDPVTGAQTKEAENTFEVDNMTKSLVGIDIGVGYAFPLSNNFSIIPRIGYQHIFTKVVPAAEGFDTSKQLTQGPVPITSDNAHIRSLQFSAMLMFNL